MKFEVDYAKIESDIEQLKTIVASNLNDPAPKSFIHFFNKLVSSICHCNDEIKQSLCSLILEIFSKIAYIKKYHQSYRHEFVKAIMRLGAKNIIPAIVTFEKLLPLTVFEDNISRTLILRYMVHDMRKRNHKGNPVELNKKTKTLLNKYIETNKGNNANFAARIFVLLFNKNIWDDQWTANALANCCLHESGKVKTTALKFFLNKSAKSKDESESESENEVNRMEKMRKLKLAHRVGKKSQARQKHLDKELDNLRKKSKKDKKKTNDPTLECNVSAIQLLRDPQVFAEKLFGRMAKANVHIRMMMLELLSRLIGYHKLQLVNYYPYINKYLNPRTNDVTNLLVYAVQASHEFVSPEDIQPVVKMVADQFANEGISGEGIALGLNTIREICARCPHAMPEDLLPLLIEFRDHRNKNVVSATRSLIRLFRQIGPNLLPKCERGRPTEATVDADIQGDATKLPTTFGALTAVSFVPGAEVISKRAAKKDKKESNEEENDDAEEDDEWEEEEIDEYETCSDEGSEEWVDISQSGEESNECDEEDEDDEEKDIKNPEERRKLAEELSYHHIFTDEEHKAIKQYNIRKTEIGARKNGKRKMDTEIEIDSETEEIIDPNAPAEFVTERIITKMAKKIKSSKEEKLASVQDGRIDRAKFGFSVNRFNSKASTTNREKAKKKNYMMVKHKKKAQDKNLSLKAKNKKLQARIMKQAKFLRS